MIYLLRHGETVFNAAGRVQGQVDSPLTTRGQAQATAMGRRLAGLVGDDFHMFVSPLGRTKQSAARIAAELGPARISLDPRLMEVSMGAWDGMTDFEIETEYPGARDGLPARAWYFHGPGGERLPAFSARLAAAMVDVMADPAKVRIIVAHGVVSRVIRAQWQGIAPEASLALPVPQDAFFALLPGGTVERIDCPQA